MLRTSLVALSLALSAAACGGSSKPEPVPPDNTGSGEPADPDPTPEEPATVTAQECEASGGTVAWDIGDGSVQCPAGTVESSKVSGGVEAGLCCQPPADGAE